MNRKIKKSNYAFNADYKLVQRLIKCIQDSDDPENIDLDSMVEDLRLNYKEYGRRQKCAFRALAIRTYKMLLDDKKIELDEEKHSNSGNEMIDLDSDMDVEDEEEYEEEQDEENNRSPNDNTDINDSTIITPIRKLPVSYLNAIEYSANGKTPNNASTVKDPINISSDEEDGCDDDQNFQKLKRMPEIKEIPAPQKATIYLTNNYRPPMVSGKQNNKKRHSVIELPRSSAKRMKTSEFSVPQTNFEVFGGYPNVLLTVNELVGHIKEGAIYSELGSTPPRGFLLHGPPGCGKTLLAQAVAGELKVPFIKVSGPELVTGISGESESRIRELFTTAIEKAPCVLFIDEIDAICPPRDSGSRGLERRIVAQLLASIDELNDNTQVGHKIVIIGATLHPDALDPALRRAGRFDREVSLGIPDRKGRYEILKVLTTKMKIRQGLNLEMLAAATPGFVGADLRSLTSQAAIAAVSRHLEALKTISTETATENSNLELVIAENVLPKNITIEVIDVDNSDTTSKTQIGDLHIEMNDFTKALKSVQPSAKREGFATVPDVTWNDIGSLRDIRTELEFSIMMPVKHPDIFENLGITSPTGILLCGPPGCGKTLLAKAVANEANINFISVKGPELLNMYVGESERAVRQCFQRAKNSQPCVIFFDEVDALCPKRAPSSEGHNTTSRVVNQLLTEMDGVEDRNGVFLMAATNRPDMIDPAVLRPGRFDKIFYVGLPSPSDRVDILKALTKEKPPMKDVDLDIIGRSDVLEGYTGADLAALVKEASIIAFTKYLTHKNKDEVFVTSDMIEDAALKIRPSVSESEREHYNNLKKQYGSIQQVLTPNEI